MKDKIKIEELKMFVGTGLQCKYPDDEMQIQIGELTSVCTDPQYAEIILDGSDNSDCEDICPQVKSLNKMPSDEYIDIFKIPKKFLCESYEFHHIKHSNHLCRFKYYKTGDFIAREYLSIRQLNELVKRHYDIFNWIGRGLADELED